MDKRVIRVDESSAEDRELRIEIPRRGEKRELMVEIPAGLELSEKELETVAATTHNEIVDIIRGAQAAKSAIKIVIQIEFVERIVEK